MAQAPWYDPTDPGRLHDDLRTNYWAAVEVIARRPSTQRHFDTCSVCASIRADRHAGPAPLATRKESVWRITAQDMRRLLKLPDSYDVVVMWAEMNPNAVYVKLAGADLPAVAEGAPAPLAGETLPEAA